MFHFLSVPPDLATLCRTSFRRRLAGAFYSQSCLASDYAWLASMHGGLPPTMERRQMAASRVVCSLLKFGDSNRRAHPLAAIAYPPCAASCSVRTQTRSNHLSVLCRKAVWALVRIGAVTCRQEFESCSSWATVGREDGVARRRQRCRRACSDCGPSPSWATVGREDGVARRRQRCRRACSDCGPSPS